MLSPTIQNTFEIARSERVRERKPPAADGQRVRLVDGQRFAGTVPCEVTRWMLGSLCLGAQQLGEEGCGGVFISEGRAREGVGFNATPCSLGARQVGEIPCPWTAFSDRQD